MPAIPKPTKLPRWASDDAVALITEPPEGGAAGVTCKDNGHIPGTSPSASEMNWLQNLEYLWCQYLDDIQDQTFTAGGVGAWSGQHNHTYRVQIIDASNTGSALFAQCTSGNQFGVEAYGHGSAAGVSCAGGVTGAGCIGTGGTTSGPGVWGIGGGGNAVGVLGQGHGGGAGVSGISANLATPGVLGTGTVSGALGVKGIGNGSGSGVEGTGGASASPGVMGFGVTGGAGPGVQGQGDGIGPGVFGQGGASAAPGLWGQGGTGGQGVAGFGDGAGAGVLGVGDSAGAGHGVQGNALGSGHAGHFTSTLGTGYALYASRGSSTSTNTFFVDGKNNAPIKVQQLTALSPAIEIVEGHIVFDTSVTEPAITADPGADVLYPSMIVKAWALIDTSGPTIMGGVGISGASLSGGGHTALTVTMAHAMANANYGVMALGQESIRAWAWTADQADKTTTTFIVRAAPTVPGASTPILQDLSGSIVFVMVMGRQT